jgi:hypothetical protein
MARFRRNKRREKKKNRKHGEEAADDKVYEKTLFRRATSNRNNKIEVNGKVDE